MVDVALELHKFNNITFYDAEHKYFIDGKEQLSVTTFIDHFKPKFDEDKWSKKKADQIGITQQQMLDEWQLKNSIACDKGSAFHNFAENYVNGKVFEFDPEPFNRKYGQDLLSEPLKKITKMFQQFHHDSKANLVPIRSELVVGDADLGLCGMVDQLYFNKKSGFQGLQIWDWKTNKKIDKFSKFDNRYDIPISHLYECEFITYSLQLSLYRYLIEKNTSLEIKKCYFVWFHPNNEKYEIFECLDLTADIQKMTTHAKSVGILPK